MGRAAAEFSMSLDGFVATPTGEVGPLFDWYGNGPVAVETDWPHMTWQVTEASAGHLRAIFEEAGAIVTGRRLFDHTQGWGGHHPIGVPVVVCTHSVPEGWPREDAPVHVVTDGVEAALAKAQELAGDRTVGVAGPNIAQQLLNLGLLDDVRINLVPVLLGEGIPFFANLAGTPVTLENPRVVQGDRVTHLYYEVRRQ